MNEMPRHPRRMESWQAPEASTAPYRVTLDLGAVIYGGVWRMDAVRVIVDVVAEPITAAGWRKISVPTLVQRAIADLKWRRDWGPGSEATIGSLTQTRVTADGSITMEVLNELPEDFLAIRREEGQRRRDALGLDRAVARGGRPRTLNRRSEIQRVAEIFKAAVARNDWKPLQAVVDQFRDDHGNPVSTRTASRRVSEAREAGLIPPKATRKS